MCQSEGSSEQGGMRGCGEGNAGRTSAQKGSARREKGTLPAGQAGYRARAHIHR